MQRFWQLIWLSFALGALHGSVAWARCTKDTDCKGDRICVDGVCQTAGGMSGAAVPAEPAEPPMPAPAETVPEGAAPPPPAPPPPPAAPMPTVAAESPRAPAGPVAWPRFYGSIGPIIAFGGSASVTAEASGYPSQDYSFSTGFGGGLHLGGYYALRSFLHLGAYVDVVSSTYKLDSSSAKEDITRTGLGAAVKVGARLSERIWLGGALDVGLAIASPETGDSYLGLHLFPRVHVDVMVYGAGKLKIGAFGDLGALMFPILGRPIDGTDTYSGAYIKGTAEGSEYGVAMILGANIGV